jgi:RNA recognition motif-containing protein
MIDGRKPYLLLLANPNPKCALIFGCVFPQFCAFSICIQGCSNSRPQNNNTQFHKTMSVRLYIGNLSFDASSDDLREIFSKTGEVEEAIIVTRPGGGRPRGFGFVTMVDQAGADEAIRQLDGQEFAGRALCVNVAKERDGE